MPAATEATTKNAYRVEGDGIEACNCQHGCNCQFAGYPNEGKCEFILAYQVRKGRLGDVSLDGVRVVIAGKYPNAIHEGNGHVALFIDDKASDAQAGAMGSILSGKMGGMPWEAIAGTITRLDGPIRKPITMTLAGEKSQVRVDGAVEMQMTPLRDMVSGAEKEVHIVYPKGGFFWDDGRIATTVTMRVEHGDLQLEWPGRYASAHEIKWTNQE